MLVVPCLIAGMGTRAKRKGFERLDKIAQRVLVQAAEQMELRKGEHSGPPGLENGNRHEERHAKGSSISPSETHSL